MSRHRENTQIYALGNRLNGEQKAGGYMQGYITGWVAAYATGAIYTDSERNEQAKMKERTRRIYTIVERVYAQGRGCWQPGEGDRR